MWVKEVSKQQCY